MKSLKYVTAILIAVGGLLLQQAQAHLLEPDTFFTNGPIGNPGNELGYLETHGGGIYQPTYLPAYPPQRCFCSSRTTTARRPEISVNSSL
jgi:hypothetical protein